jgi:hypothetical protein
MSYTEAAPKQSQAEALEASDEMFAPSLQFVAFLAVVYLLYDLFSYSAPASAVALAVFLSASISAIALGNLYVGVVVFTVVLILSDDLSKFSPQDGGRDVTNVLTLPIGGIALINYIAIFLILLAAFLLVIRWSRYPVIWMPTASAASLFLLGLSYSLGALHGISTILSNFRGALNDLSLPIMGLGLAFVIRLSITTRQELLQFWQILLNVVAAKAVVWLIWFSVGIGFQHGTTIRPTNESGRILLVFLLIYGLLLQSRQLQLRATHRRLGLFLIATSTFLILIIASRGTWVAAASGLFLLWAISSLREKQRIALISITVGCAIIFGLLQFRPETLTTVRYFAGTLRFWQDEGMGYSQSNLIRIYEFKNIHAQLVDHNNLLLGEGPGSKFSDKYHPFPMGLRESDYPIDEILKAKFESPHTIVATILLNNGYLGLTVYFGGVLLLFLRLFQLFQLSSHPALSHLVAALFAFFPAAVYFCWTAKTNMFFGLFLGSIWVVDSLYTKPKEIRIVPTGFRLSG